MTSDAREDDVLNFYRNLPFNYHSDKKLLAAEIRRANPLRAYPPLIEGLRLRPNLLDVGSGSGWLVNAAAFHHGCAARGIDFNPVVVERARETGRLLDVDVEFEVADLFTYRPGKRFQLVTSIVVLHHTADCFGAIRHIGRTLVDEVGRMRRSGNSQDAMFAAFRQLYCEKAKKEDETLISSWFRDQVLHPRGTSHTLDEILDLLPECGFTLEFTSINNFASLPIDRRLLKEQEKTFEKISEEALSNSRFFPRFFVFMARRKPVLD